MDVKKFLEERLKFWKKENEKWRRDPDYLKSHIIHEEAYSTACVCWELIYIMHLCFGKGVGAVYRDCPCENCQSVDWTRI